MFDPLTIGVGVAIWAALKKQAVSHFGILTPEREEVYRNAMDHLMDPSRLKTLAEAFDKEGLKIQGKLLRLRAEWRSRSDELRKAHEEVFKKALASENVAGILKVAQAFQQMTATRKAKTLFDHAKTVKEKNQKKDSNGANMNIHNEAPQSVDE